MPNPGEINSPESFVQMCQDMKNCVTAATNCLNDIDRDRKVLSADSDSASVNAFFDTVGRLHNNLTQTNTAVNAVAKAALDGHTQIKGVDNHYAGQLSQLA